MQKIKEKKPYYINCEKGEEINSDNYEEIIGKEKLYVSKIKNE